MSRPGEDFMRDYADKLDKRERDRNTAKSCPDVKGHYVERPMGRGPTFVPEVQSGAGDYNYPPYHVGDFPYWRENNIPGFPPPGDHFPHYPKDPMPDRIFPQEWPYGPPKTPDEIDEIIKKAKKMEPCKQSLEYEERTLGDKIRCIDFSVPGHDKTTLTVTLKDGQIVIRGGKNPMAVFPRQIHQEFPYNNKDEEVLGAHIAKGILTITIKNIKVEVQPQAVPITGE